MCIYIQGLPRWLVKSLFAKAGDMGLISGLGRSPGERMATHSSILAWKSHGQRSLVGCSHGVSKEVGHDLVTKQTTIYIHKIYIRMYMYPYVYKYLYIPNI